jgi:hypothetical protein
MKDGTFACQITGQEEIGGVEGSIPSLEFLKCAIETSVSVLGHLDQKGGLVVGVVYILVNPSTQVVEAGGLRVRDHTMVHFKTLSKNKGLGM